MFAPHELGAIKGHPDISSGGPETLVIRLDFDQPFAASSPEVVEFKG
jgi:hypothetical protein